jgi:hypothetical protein
VMREFKGSADDFSTGGSIGVSGVPWPIFRLTDKNFVLKPFIFFFSSPIIQVLYHKFMCLKVGWWKR